MAYLLNVAYLALIALVSPWLAWSAIRKGKYRQGWRQKAFGLVPRRAGDRPCVWLHAVSVGEVNLLAPLLRRLEQQLPDWDVVISSTTQTGFDLARRKYAPRLVFFCPLDFSWAVNNALRRMRPNALVLAELELWPNLITAARRRGVKIAVVNGRLGEKSRRGYGRIRPLIARVLRRIDLIAAQNEESARRFRELGARLDTVTASGSLKFDGVEMERDNHRTRRLANLAGITPDDLVFLAGSTQAPEERMAIEAFQRLRSEFPRLRLIITPRHPERFVEVARLLDESGLRWQRRTRLEQDGADPQARTLLVDGVGELGAWWGAAHVAYVGGSMGSRGGQNMIEPAAYGAAVSFGPHTHNFREIVRMLLDAKAAVVVHNGNELTAFVRQCLEDPVYARALGENGRAMVRRHQGAADRTVELLTRLLASSSAKQRAA